MPRGQFITLEGTEGAGKTTVLSFIKNYLAQMSLTVLWTREPGGTPLAEDIRRLVLKSSPDEEVMPETELLLMFAARVQHLNKIILPALNAGKWVVSDRYIDASYAYQIGGRGIAEKYLKFLDAWLIGTHYPALTLLLDIPPALGLERAQGRGTHQDRIEAEQLDFFDRVRAVYLKRAQDDPERIKIIDASQQEFAVESQIKTILDAFIKGK